MPRKAFVTSDSRKGAHIVDLMRVELERAKLSDSEAQAIIEHGGEFQNNLKRGFDAVRNLDHNARGIYPRLYKVKGIEEQVGVLRKYFPTAEYVMSGLPGRLPAGAEGWFAIPDWHAIGITYNEAVAAVVAALDCRLKGQFMNSFREEQFREKYLREYPRKMKYFKEVAQQQGTKEVNIWLVPAQFGIRFRGDSSRGASLAMNQCEYPLGVYELGVMLLTHPERLRGDSPLFINCAGDEFSYAGDGKKGFIYSMQFGNTCFMPSLECVAENSGHDLYSVPSAFSMKMFEDEVEGYIIESDPGKFLTKSFDWCSNELTDAWVHPTTIFETLLKVVDDSWVYRPKLAYPAVWNKDTGTVITGSPIRY